MMENKRIAILTPYGAEPRFDNYGEFIMAKALQERGWDVRLYTYGMSSGTYAKDLMYRGIAVSRCRVWQGISPKLFFSLLLFRPRTILAFHPKSMLNFSAYFAARMTGARFIATIVGILHDPFIVDDTDDPYEHIKKSPVLITNSRVLLNHLGLHTLKWLWENYSINMPRANADTIIAINEEEKKYVQKLYGRAPERIYYCSPRYQIEETKRPAGNIPEKFLFFIGQMKRRKGWDTAIEALAILKQRGHDGRLVCVATHADIEEAMRLARERGVEERITFLSSISNAERQWLYENAHAVLVPSRFESFGIPVFESFLAGVPLVASDIPVFKEFLTDRKNAMLFQMGSADSLARAIVALDADPSIRERLIAEGKKTAADFDYRRMTDAYEKII